MHCRPTEQELSQRVDAVTAAGLPRVRDVAGEKGHRLAVAVFDVGKLAVTSDLRFREAERVVALGLDHGRATAARQIAMFRNAGCLELLRDELRPAIAAVREEFGGYEPGDTKAAFDAFEREAREGLMSIDLNARRARIAGRTLGKVRATADQDGISGLCDELERQCDRLIELREERSRHNGPIGVVVGGAIAATGFLILGICSALSGGRRCSNPTVEILGDMFIAVGLFVVISTSGGGEDESGDEEGGGINEM